MVNFGYLEPILVLLRGFRLLLANCTWFSATSETLSYEHLEEGLIRKGNFLPENGAKKFPSSIVFFVPFLFHTFGYSSLFLLPTCFSATKFLSRQSFKLGSKTHARQSPFTPAVQRAMQWSNPYHNVCHLYFLGWICFNSDEMCFWNLDWDLCSAWNIPSRQIKEAHITSSSIERI